MRNLSFLNRHCSKSTVGYQLKIVIDNRTVSKRLMTGTNSGYVPEFFICYLYSYVIKENVK